jgi:hypothetical protein
MEKLKSILNITEYFGHGIEKDNFAVRKLILMTNNMGCVDGGFLMGSLKRKKPMLMIGPTVCVVTGTKKDS